MYIIHTCRLCSLYAHLYIIYTYIYTTEVEVTEMANGHHRHVFLVFYTNIHTYAYCIAKFIC